MHRKAERGGNRQGGGKDCGDGAVLGTSRRRLHRLLKREKHLKELWVEGSGEAAGGFKRRGIGKKTRSKPRGGKIDEDCGGAGRKIYSKRGSTLQRGGIRMKS